MLRMILRKSQDLGYNVKTQQRRRWCLWCRVLHRPNVDVRKCNIKKYSTFECLEVTVKGNNELLRITTIYRSGKLTLETRNLFLSQINEYCETLLLKI